MRRGLVHAGAWLLASGAAVTLSWFGVRVVVPDTAYEGPAALPLTGRPPAPPASAGGEPRTDSTRRPLPPPGTDAAGAPRSSSPAGPTGALRTAGPPGASRTADRAGRGDGGHGPDASGGQRPREASGTVESHDLRGGRVVFDLGPDSATLVSASPNGGWEMRVWQESHWIRVTFTRGGEASSAHCAWNGSPPRVVIDEHGG
ncbi:hypothetical protein ACFSJS_19220 [Streptomyces desertarenae]|uniref:Secreted protein n=1 Tax=Streptomyces desertarenae TaxID=2666184 RepID=A0ABW4PLX5_9ACTN